MTTDTTLAPTPGPWTVHRERGGSIWIDAAAPEIVARIEPCDYMDGRGERFRPEDIANASLIAAAPDLLEALRMCAHFIENVSESTPDRTERFFSCRESWRRAIARAEGRTP
jgi:hypothetical protein